jgi:hypothetical protein
VPTAKPPSFYSDFYELPILRVTVNVYTRATGWGALVTLALLAGVLVLDVWLMSKLPILRHGVGYAMLQIGMVGLLLTALRLIFRGGSHPRKD